MAVAAAEKRAWRRSTRTTARDGQGLSAATDNVGLFFGEDIFIAIGSIMLIQQTLATYGYHAGAARARALGDPDRDRRLPDPAARLLLLDRSLRAAPRGDAAP